MGEGLYMTGRVLLSSKLHHRPTPTPTSIISMLCSLQSVAAVRPLLNALNLLAMAPTVQSCTCGTRAMCSNRHPNAFASAGGKDGFKRLREYQANKKLPLAHAGSLFPGGESGGSLRSLGLRQ